MIEEISGNLPEFLIYIVSGFLFIRVFNFVSFKSNDSDVSHILVSTVSVGFVVKYLFDLLNLKCVVNIPVYYLLLCLASVVSAYFVGILYNSKVFEIVLDLLKINRTVNKDIWDDIIDRMYSTFAKIQMKSGKIYFGKIRVTEENNRSPYIIIYEYQVINEEGDILSDYTNDRKYQMLIDTSEADTIEIMYDGRSRFCK